MVITLELTPEQERRVASAVEQGVDVQKLMLNTLHNTLNNLLPVTNAPTGERKKRALEGYGMFAHSTCSVEDFMREKQEEIDREEQQLLRLGNENG